MSSVPGKLADPSIDANRAFSVLKQLKDALSAIEGRALFVSGSWSHTKSDYAKLIREWPITEVGFHRCRSSGLFLRILELFRFDFVLKLEDPAFLVNVFRIFKFGRAIAAWSIGKEEEKEFKVALLAQSREPDGSSTKLWGDLVQFAPNLLYLYLLEDIGYDEPFLWLHCGEQAPRELKKIITDNNLEPYIEHRGDD